MHTLSKVSGANLPQIIAWKASASWGSLSFSRSNLILVGPYIFIFFKRSRNDITTKSWSLPVVAYRRFKTIRSVLKLLGEIAVGVAYRRWSFTRGSSIRLWLRTFFVFLGRWSLTGGGRTWRFDCTGCLHKKVCWSELRTLKVHRNSLMITLILLVELAETQKSPIFREIV